MRKLLFNNFGLKVLSLLLAVVSWYAIRETISFEVSLPDIPLELRMDEGWAILHQSANAVTVTFRGSQEDIRLMDHKQIKAVVLLGTNSIAGKDEITITPQAIEGIRGVRAVRVEPEKVAISLDHKSEKRVPVKARTVGKPFAGEVENMICDPAIVLVHGPAQQLAQTEWVYTEPIDVDGRIESFTKRCRVVPPSNTWTPQIEPAEVKVEIVIVEKTETLEFKDIPVAAFTKPGLARTVEITPSQVTVVLTGSADNLKSLKGVKPKAFVDCVDLDASLTYDLPVFVYLPPGKNVSTASEPSAVHVVFRERPQVE